MKKFVAAITLVSLVLFWAGPVRALDVPTPPTPPPAPTEPTAPPAPTPPSEPTPPPVPTLSTPTPTPIPESTPTPSPSPVAVAVAGSTPSGQTGADVAINTGDAATTVVGVTDANSNLALWPAGGGSGGLAVVNLDNGDGSTNTGSATVLDSWATYQINEANVANTVDQQAITGDNSASSNTGGDSTITTGDANVSGTLITLANTNAAGMVMSEFDIVDDHLGDYVLDFAANCVLGCGGGDTTVANSGNGTGSTNTAGAVEVVDITNFQTNDATLANSLVLLADSGHNSADRNTGGDSTITTGDANVAANSLTLANNNLEGNIIYGVVNIYGDLVGDIIFPEEYLASCCGVGPTTAVNAKNGDASTNTATVDSTVDSTTVQTNVATITNQLDIAAVSGDNNANRNTDGDVSITTGDTSIDAQVLNVANSNVEGTWWLVLVNEAGEWIGRILGAPEGSNFAGSEGSEFAVNAAGEITVVNNGNGDNSTNGANVSQATSDQLFQTNNLNLVNNMKLTADTGENSTTSNTGGDNSITTGDARIVANLVNFVNNNISGGGKLVVTVVNVFGSWLGDFVGPGYSKPSPTLAAAAAAIGGADVADPTADSSGSSTPTPTPVPVSAANPVLTGESAVTASVQNTGGGNGSGSGLPQTSALVAGYTTAVDSGDTASAVAGKRTIRINLAWLLLIVPMGGIFLVIRKKLLARAA